MVTLANNTPLILAIVAVATVLVNLVGLILQSRRDSSDYVAKRLEEAVKISHAAQELVDPLRTELAEARKDYSVIKDLSLSQAKLLEDASVFRDKTLHQLMVVSHDRDNLLAERIVEQKQVDLARSERDAADAERDTANAERNGITKERNGITHARDELQARFDSLEATVHGLKAEIERLKNDKGDYNGTDIQA